MDDEEGDGLHTLAIVLLLCGALKLLHTLGLINTEGELKTYDIKCKHIILVFELQS